MADPVVTPEGWLARGDAYVRGDGVQLAVFGGIPGERARVRLTGGKGRQEFAKWVAPSGKAHPDRVKPACDRLTPCGRCSIMHLNWSGQDRMRLELVRDALREVRLEVPVQPVVRGADTDALLVTTLVAGRSDQGRIRLGFPARDGREVVAVPDCLVVTPAIRNLMGAAAWLLQDLDLWPWDGRKGTVRALRVVQSTDTGELLVIIGAARQSPVLGEFAEKLAARHGAVAGVLLHLEESGREAFPPDKEGEILCTPLYGKLTVDVTIEGHSFRVGPSEPVPTYPAMAGKVAVGVAELLDAAPGDAVVDLACGIGLRTRVLAARSGWALGVDPRAGIVRRARENAAGSAAEFATELDVDRLAAARPLVSVDVGTRGLQPEQVDAIVALRPRRVVLAGSNPRSFARGLEALVARGHRVDAVRPYDVAPHTPFVELVARVSSLDETPAERRAPRRRTVRGA